jgi:hypothetical protein
MFLPYAVEDNIERKSAPPKQVKVQRDGWYIQIKIMYNIFEGNLVFLYKIYTVGKKKGV